MNVELLVLGEINDYLLHVGVLLFHWTFRLGPFDRPKAIIPQVLVFYFEDESLPHTSYPNSLV